MTASSDHFKSTAPHVIAKHAILSGYLDAWFRILGARFGRLIYLDGFAGPGTFEDGSEGSPIRALRVALGVRPPSTAGMHFHFIEKDGDFARQLGVDAIPKLKLPDNVSWQVHPAEFDDVAQELLAQWQSGEFAEAPMFAFIDPFGVKGVPFSTVRSILKRPSAEVFVTFMNEGVRRCIKDYPEHVNALLGSDTAAAVIGAAGDKVATARHFYRDALLSTGAKVCGFQIRDDRNRPLYDLFFATHSPLGYTKMKEAMWRVDRSGFFLFSDAADPAQQQLFTETPGVRLAPILHSQFCRQTVEIERVVKFAEASPTFLKEHVRSALRAMELDGGVHGLRVRVCRAAQRNGRKASVGQFPPGTTVEFLGTEATSE